MHPRYMTTDWFFSESIVPKGSLEQVIEGAFKKRGVEEKVRWYPLRGGIETLAQSFLRFVKNVNLNKRAIKVDSSKRKVTFGDGEVVHYQYLLNTIPLPELIKSKVLLYRLSSSAAASYMFFPGKPGSSGVNTTLFLQPIWLIAIWLIAAFKEYRERPDPLQTTQLADFKSSYSGNSFCLLTSRRLSLILLTYPK